MDGDFIKCFARGKGLSPISASGVPRPAGLLQYQDLKQITVGRGRAAKLRRLNILNDQKVGKSFVVVQKPIIDKGTRNKQIEGVIDEQEKNKNRRVEIDVKKEVKFKVGEELEIKGICDAVEEKEVIEVKEQQQFDSSSVDDVEVYKTKLIMKAKGQCICERDIVKLSCHECNMKFRGRPNIACPIHTNVIHLMDMTHCPSCRILL